MDIRQLTTLEEIDAARAVWRAVWDDPPRDRMPREMLRAMTAHTSLLLGALDGDRCVAAVFGTWGRTDAGELFLWSSRLGVLPERRGTGVAEGLKRAQADHAAERGVRALRWSFDPMRARNAAFNLRKLGATAVAFRRDLYGERGDTFNAGRRTDRLLVEWRPHDGAHPRDAVERRVEISGRSPDDLAADLEAAFGDGLVAIGFEPPGAYTFGRVA